MRIVGVQSIRLVSRPTLIWVQILTDEGVSGLGESWFGAGAVEADLHERIAPLILGEDPRRIERLHRLIRPYVGFAGTGAEARAGSAVDVALWDLNARAAGRPLYDLLGGAVRDAIPVYNTCAGPAYVSSSSEVRPGNFGLPAGQPVGGPGAIYPGAVYPGAVYEDLQAFMERPHELAAELMDMGIYAMKIWPFDFAAGAEDGMDISGSDLARALAPFESIRRAHGDAIRIKAELHGLWSLPAAKKIADALEPIEVDWIEDPLWMDRPGELNLLAGGIRAPVAGGETLGGLGAFRELINGGGVSVPIMDVTWGGGISVARKVAALAESAALPVAFHDCSGPVTLAASTHLALACPNVVEQEITRAFYYGWYHEVVEPLPMLENGHITVGGPGLGVQLRPEVARRDDAQVRMTA